MKQAKPQIGELLSKLEKFYGLQEPSWPTEPYEFLVWWYCGYPASDAACAKGWERLKSEIGIDPEKLLKGHSCEAGQCAQAGRDGAGAARIAIERIGDASEG